MNGYRNPQLPIEERVNDLISQMTLEEKVDQLEQITIGQDLNPNNAGEGSEFRPTVGSVLSYFGGLKKRNEFQKIAVEQTRLGIPIIWGYDVIHGWRTSFPVPLAQACTWDTEVVEKGCRVAAMEAKSAGVDWTFAPMVDVPNDPRWGRVMESFGEDPYASGVFGRASVRGYQTADPSQPGTVAACLKHFVGYAASEAGRDYSYTDISPRKLHEIYLPPFQAGVEEGALTLMSSFNDITGTPAVVNKYTMTEVLRGRWGFKGFVVSDWDATKQLANQGYTKNLDKIAVDCLTAGNDMEMVSGIYARLVELVKSDKCDIAVIDQAVRRVLHVKFALGLFENPYTEERPESETMYRPESLATALEAARKCVVLLKNENAILPLDTKKSVALIGPVAGDSAALVGNWSARVLLDTVKPLNKVVGEYFDQVYYAPGCDFEAISDESLSEALAAAAQADVLLVAIGEQGNRAGENCSYADIALPQAQRTLLEKLAGLGKPIVLLVTSGRPIIYSNLEPYADAILHLWQGGQEAARGCFDVLTGVYNPSGRLAMTFPRSVGQIPIYYNQHRRARPDQGNYHDLDESPMYPFGYGLSYTEYQYSELTVSADMKVSVRVTNTGKRSGTETVFVYLSDPEAALTQPIRRLIAFHHVEFQPQETQKIEFQLDRMGDLAYIDSCGQKVFEPGEFIVTIGDQTCSFDVK